jgi:hypothetical protein
LQAPSAGYSRETDNFVSPEPSERTRLAVSNTKDGFRSLLADSHSCC